MAGICDELGVTADTRNVLLHRANLHLRQALRSCRVPAHGQGGLLASRA